MFRPCHFPLHPDSSGFRAIIGETLLEPRMFECFWRRDALGRIVDKDPAQEVKELLVEGC